MKRLMAGGLALGFTAVGSLALGAPAGAQEDPGPDPDIVELQGQLSATSVAPGEDVTASSVDPCTVPEEGEPGQLYWLVWNTDTGTDQFEDVVDLEADGSWEVTFQAPGEAGNYQFGAVCVPSDIPDEEEELEALESQGLEALGDEPEEPTPDEPEGEEPEPFTYEAYFLDFTVDGGDGPPVTEPSAPTPPAAAPAQPVAGEPDFTG
jgi:hypothetical protein